jgi:uncharacterized membrane protein
MNPDCNGNAAGSALTRLPTDPASPVRQELRNTAAWLSSCLGVAYPVATHLAVAKRSAMLTVLAMVILVALVMIPWLASGRILAWLLLPAVAAGCWLLSGAHLALLPLYLPPVVIPAGIAWLFARTLRQGQVPLIEQFARAMEQPGRDTDTQILRYARHLTGVWAALLFSLGLINLLLAAFATPHGLLLALGFNPSVTLPQEAWSLFANFLGYLIIVAFFGLEYAFRRYRFPQTRHHNFIGFIQRTLAVSPRLLGRQR